MMSLPHYFSENKVIAEEQNAVFEPQLSSDDLHHMKVTRIKEGEHIVIIDADKDYFECEVVSLNPQLEVKIASRMHEDIDSPHIILIQGFPKADKFEDIIKHATELGVDCFVGYPSRRSIIKIDKSKLKSKMERWESIVKNAAMQSGRNTVPQIDFVFEQNQIEALLKDSYVLVCWEKAESHHSLARAVGSIKEDIGDVNNASIAVIVGPEGGFEDGEFERFMTMGKRAYCVNLGHNILRTETAGMIAPALVLYEFGQLGGRL